MKKLIALALYLVLAFTALSVNAQTTKFSYQGRLTDGSIPASGTYEMQFRLFDAVVGGAQIGSTLTFDGAGGNPAAVTVSNGVFTVELEFSPATPFATGANRWLEIAVKKLAEPGYTTLTPRQQTTSAPYSIRTISATLAENANALAGQPGSFYQNATNLDSGTLPAARLPSNVALTNAANIFQAPNAVSTGVTVRGAASQVADIFAVEINTGSKQLSVNGSGNTVVSGSLSVSNGVDMSNTKTTNLATPTDALDAANKAYVDTAVTANYFQRSWESSTNIGLGGWVTLPAAAATFTTTGKPLLITMNIAMSGGSHASCRPVIDGVWAGTYGGLINTGDPFWQEGLVRVGADGSGWQRWNLNRIYPGVPGGSHAFNVQCVTNGGVLSVCGPSIGCSWGVTELK